LGRGSLRLKSIGTTSARADWALPGGQDKNKLAELQKQKETFEKNQENAKASNNAASEQRQAALAKQQQALRDLTEQIKTSRDRAEITRLVQQLREQQSSLAKEMAQAQPTATAPPQQQTASQPQPATTASPAANPSPQSASAPSPAPAPRTTSAASGGPSQTQPSSPSRSPGESPIELSEIVGRWRNTADRSIVEIEELYPGENKSPIGLKGKHDGWGGSFTRGSGDKPSHLSFQMDPKFEQMNPQAPQWARQQVDGKLRWFRELDAQGCGPALSGKWYRGEIKWTDSDQSGAAKEASVASHVRDVPVEFEKTTEQPEFDGHPAIRVRSALRKLPFTTADSLYRDEPFYVDVILPEDEAKKAGMDLTVTLHSAIGNDTSSLGLSSFSPDVHRFAVYTMLDPVTMAHGGGPVCITGCSRIWPLWRSRN